MPVGYIDGQKLEKPLFTPSTKAEQGAHDENISPEQGRFLPSFPFLNPTLSFSAAKLIGQDLYDKISSTALKLYEEAANYAQTRGVILADTKFEFGLVITSNGLEKELILIDELLTPDSSRYWPLEEYVPGEAQPSFDKQYVRDWLVKAGFRKGLESGPIGKEGQGWFIDEEIVKGTQERYAEAVDLLTRK
jgi:phosphoribosylaminoimidazole-succinocarboxamide synthase